MPTLLIDRSRKKTLFGLLLSIGFVGMSWWLWTRDPGDNTFRDWEAKLFAPVGLLVFGLLGIYSLVKLFDNKPALILNETGIHDRSGLMGYLHVHWEQVAGTSEVRVKRVRLLVVRLHDPQAFLSRYRGWRRRALEWNMKHHGSPMVIAVNTLHCDFDELARMIKAGAEAAQRAI